MNEVVDEKNPTTLHFSVVIPAYNEEEYLPNTLKYLNNTISQLDGIHGEVIVVNNGSTDQTANIARKYGATVIEEKKRGIGRARNTGAGLAKGKILVFLDADSWLSLPTLEIALEQMSSGRSGGGGALVVFDQNHGRFISGVLLPGLWNLISRIFTLAAGSFIYCRRKDFFKIGGFSEKLYAGEEIDFCITLKRLLRKTGLAFTIIRKAPVVTSSRKLLWYKDHKIFFVLLSLLIFPFAVRSRRLCSFWYHRPT